MNLIELKKTIKELSSTYFEEIKAIRRTLHQNPELSFQEFETANFLIDKLESWGINIDQRWVKTGFSVVIDSKKQGPTIALRADLDALAIQEKTAHNFQSKNKGVMHACGHDVHASCLMGVAKILHETKDNWNGKVILFFQAGEEKLPGGASLMIEEGIMKKYKPQRMIAQHVYPEMEVGKVGFREGMYMASADEIYITVIGKGGHGALPHKNIDPVVIAAHLITELQQIVSRVAPPTVPTVLSFGKVIANGATNVIPDEVKLEGTLRTMDEDWRKIYHSRIESICYDITKAHNAKCVVDIKKGYPFLVNDVHTTKTSKAAASEYLTANNVEDLGLRMTAEDFSYFSQHSPVCFYRLGVGNEQKGINKSVHSPEFDVDERAIEIGSGLMSYIALAQLSDLS